MGAAVGFRRPSLRISICSCLALLLGGCGGARISFRSGPPSPPSPSKDGASPNALIRGSDGNFYGTTVSGGAFGGGTVFSITPEGTETILYSFAGGATDGANPQGLIQGSDGSFYGTTSDGGTGTCPRSQPVGGSLASACGTVFRVTPQGEETILYFFTGTGDGGEPNGGLVQGSDGSLYGTTASGGNPSAACGTSGCGVVFQVTLSGREYVLHAFAGGAADGATPTSLMQASDGYFYGTTLLGGRLNRGTVFRVAPVGNETVLYSFLGGADGMYPVAALIEASDETLYGTTSFGGESSNSSPACTSGCGTIYRVTFAGSETVLYAFEGGNRDGANPYAPLIEASDGTFYGTTEAGGSANCSGGCGTVFQITPGVEKPLYLFAVMIDGFAPSSGLVQDSAGNLYGVTMSGGAFGDGTVFSVTPAGIETVLHSFDP